MLQVWRIFLPQGPDRRKPVEGWALAHTAEEAVKICGFDDAIATQEPDRLWIVSERVIWVP